MSHAFYQSQWQKAMEELSDTIEIENPPVQMSDNGKPLPEKTITWDEAFQHFAVLYLRYLGIQRRLEDCYDQMLHPQKRRDLKLVLEVVMARLCQVKAQCVKFGPDGRQTDYLNLENYLLDLKLGPEHLEVAIPRYYREKSDDDDSNKKRAVLDACLEEHGMLGGSDAEASAGGASWLPKLTREQAIRILQKNERGRQGLVRARLMKELRDEDAMRKKLSGGHAHAHPSAAATLIQKVFRGHLVRMRIQRHTQDEFVFLGMKSLALNQKKSNLAAAAQAAAQQAADAAGAAPPKAAKYDPLAKEASIRSQRKTRQIEHELRYIEALVELQKSVTELEGPEMKDSMWEERYQWWIEHKERTGRYPENFNQFYRERGEMPAVEKKKKKKKADKPLSAQDKAKAKAQKEKEKAAAAAKENTKQGQKKAEEERKAKLALSLKTLVGPTHLINHMHECLHRFRSVWCTLDESDNHAQGHDDELARAKLRPLIRDKIQKEVDVRLLSYLDNIRLKVAQRAAAKKAAKKKKGKGKKGKGKDAAASSQKKKSDGAGEAGEGAGAGDAGEGGAAGSGKGGASKKKKSKSGKKGSQKKKKARKCCEGEKACAHMPLGDMISLLVKMGILQELRQPLRRLADLQGDMHWIGSEYTQASVSLDPSMQQLRAVVAESAVLPQGSAYVKEQAPLVNALLLYGPQGSGKTLISKAIAAETNSCWFDLSPRTLERKLGTKAEIAKLVHMVFRVAAELQPSVVHIDECERVFAAVKSKKNVPEVVKLKQFVVAHKAMLSRQCRVLVVANSRAPFDPRVDRKELLRFFGPQHFGKMLLCPLPNYATRLQLWKSAIVDSGINFSHAEQSAKFDLNTLAYISEGYSAGNIFQAVSATLPPRRVQKLLETGRALDSSEFVSALSKTAYTYKADYANFTRFTDAITGETERRRLKELEAQRLADEKAAEQKKAPQKKKAKPAA